MTAEDARNMNGQPVKVDLDRYKEFWLTSFAIRNPTSVLVIMFMIVVMGIMAYVRIPKEASPEITIPNILVNTIYPGASPADVESIITRPLERELATIDDIKILSSSSVEGYSMVNVEFNAGTDMDEALSQVREKVDLARPELPGEVEEPRVIEINMSDFPIMQVNISGEYSQVRLKEIAEELQDRIEGIPEVLEANLSGGLEREVQVNVDLPRLKYYNLTFSDVMTAILMENITIPGGTIDVGHLKYLVRVPGEFTSTEIIEEIIISTPNGYPVYVRDVADVDFGFKEQATYARMDNIPVVTLNVTQRAGENIIETAEQVKAIIAEMESEFPPTTRVTITSDQSIYVKEMVANLENNIISGLILVVMVLLFFLGVRNAIFVGIAIPLSMLLSFIIMDLTGITMNMIVLFSLILALGMLVDNAIVMVENTYRFMEEGFDRQIAARKAAGEVAIPITAATATTLAAFAPLMFWPGIVGEFMRYLPLTLIITLSSSLFVALVINPTLCSLLMHTAKGPRRKMTRAARAVILVIISFILIIIASMNGLTSLLFIATGVGLFLLYHLVIKRVTALFLDRIQPAILRLYEGILQWSLDHRKSIIALTSLTFISSFIFFGIFNNGVEFFPENVPPDDLWIQVEAPVGTRVDFTDSIVRKIEEEVGQLDRNVDFESIVATVGMQQGNFIGGGSSTNLATVAISLVDYEARTYDAFEVLEILRSDIGQNLAGAEFSVSVPDMGPPTGLPIVIEISGIDTEILTELSERTLDMLQNSSVGPKLDGLESDLSEGRPELVVDVDREKAVLFGLSTNRIGFEIRNAINGIEASTFRDGEDEYDVIVRLAEEYRRDLDVLFDLTIIEDEKVIPLSSVASWRVSESYAGINRKDQKRVVTISSNVRSIYQPVAVLAEVQALMATLIETFPPGYTVSYVGENEFQDEAEEFLGRAFMIALFLIAFILISQFDSVIKPFIVISNVLLSIIGVLLGLIIFQMPFGVIMTGVGIISLAGIVVNNGIVLIDYIEILQERDGLGVREALIKGGMTRFRPVILTAITTVLGLIPLAIGLNIDFQGLYSTLQPNFYWGGEQAAWWGPMAIAVIAGLSFATFLTLILTPVMYSLFNDFGNWTKRVFTSSS